MIRKFGIYTLLATLLATGCVKENSNPDGGKDDPVPVEGQVRFTCTIEPTKDASDGSDAGQLLWKDGDRVRIFCAQAADAKDASYLVTPDKSRINGTVSASGTALEWNGTNDVHNFVAVYPESGAVMAKEGVLTVPMSRIQKCTVKTSDATGNDVVAEPDMSNIYMVAAASRMSAEDEVNLVFRPLMTTLEIRIPGPQGGGYSRVTGLSLSTELTSLSAATADKFYYDIAKSELVDLSRASYGVPKTRTNTVYIDLVDESGKLTYVDVGSGRTLTVTAFLPPLSVSDAESIKAGISVRVHIASDTEILSTVRTSSQSAVDPVSRIPASSRCVFQLPSAVSGAASGGNNWLTRLPDNLPVSQLSLPGTHDAATMNCSAVGKCQVYSIADQLKRGVRVFDLRPAMKDNYNLNNIYHGFLDTGVSMGSAFNDFNTYLSANPGEFVIVLMRYETDSKNVDINYYNAAMRSFLNGNSGYQSRKATFRPDLKVGDLRGRILIISRNDLTPDSGIETAYTGWSSSNVSGDKRTVSGTGGTADIYIQDMYSQDCDGGSSDDVFLANKKRLVCEMMDLAGRFSTETALKSSWLVNYTSAYVGTRNIFGYKVPNDNSYARNAAATNAAAVDYIVLRKAAAPTGIVMMDFAGASVYNVGGADYAVCGDMLLQRIIDNNYRW